MGERKKFFSGGNANAAAWGGEPAPESVATVLRDARLRLGVELRDAAAMLRIRYPYLEAIEHGRYGELPGTAYATGFLRSYAEFLGLDQEEILRRYKDEVAGRVGKQELYFPTPVSEGRVPGGGLLFATVLLGSMVYGGWYYLSATDRSMVDLVPALPDRFVSLLDNLPWNTPVTPPAPATDGMAADSVAAVPDATSVPPPPAALPAAPPAAPMVTAQAPVVPAPASAVPPPAPAAGGASGAATPPAAAPTVTPPPVAPPPVVMVPPPTAPIPPRSPVPAPVPAQAQPQPAPASPAQAAPQQAASLPPAEDDEADMSTQEPTLLKPDSAVLQQATAPQPAVPTTDKPVTEGKVYGNQNPAARVQIRAVQDSWVQIREPNGEKVLERVLKAGDVFRAPDKAGLRLRTGNAGGLVMIVDGVESKPLGSTGQVLRDVPLDGSAPRATAGR